ncbi:hypothetical protein MMYC01_201217, partial [Madurella mycetomatis]
RNLPPNPEIVELEQQREQLKGGQYRIRGQDDAQEIQNLARQIRNKKAQRVKEIDIEPQARGEEEEEYIEPAIDLQIPERTQLTEILCHQPEGLSPATLLERRIQAAKLMVALCDKRETAKCRHVRQNVRSEVSVKDDSPAPDPFPLPMQKTQCPRCIGDETLPYETRVFPYCRPSVMNGHFDREHLEDLKGKERYNLIFCKHPRCSEEGVKLTTLDHFRAHVMNIHGVELRTGDRVKSFPKPLVE